MALTQWTAFVEVCRTGSIGGAAVALGYTQSAVSRQVAALESDLQVRLLERLPRGVRPTPAGQALLRHAQIVVNEAERGRQAVRDAVVASRHLAVGAVPSAASTIVPAALAALQVAGEAIRWSVVPALTQDLVAMVRQREVDLAVVTDAPPGLPAEPGVQATHVGDDEPVAVVPRHHPLAQGSERRIRLQRLATERWIEDNAGSESMLRGMAARAGVPLQIDRSATDLLTKTGMVAAGHGVALVPGLLVAALRADVAVLRLVDAPARGIFVLRRAPGEQHEAFVRAIGVAVEAGQQTSSN